MLNESLNTIWDVAPDLFIFVTIFNVDIEPFSWNAQVGGIAIKNNVRIYMFHSKKHRWGYFYKKNNENENNNINYS